MKNLKLNSDLLNNLEDAKPTNTTNNSFSKIKYHTKKSSSNHMDDTTMNSINVRENFEVLKDLKDIKVEKEIDINDDNEEEIDTIEKNRKVIFQQETSNAFNENSNLTNQTKNKFPRTNEIENQKYQEEKSLSFTNDVIHNLQKEFENVIISDRVCVDKPKIVKAIPFISVSYSNNKDKEDPIYEVTEESISFLNGIKENLGVISVAGMYRTGKSYLLNKIILNQDHKQVKNDEISSFQVGPTISACTKGLWIYPEVIEIINKNGEKINLVVIDTEGIGATDEDCNHDTKIFSLSLLLSSFFIYNSVGSIDENALSNLSFVSNLAKHLQVKDDTKPYLPSFLWVLRDFSLKLIDENGNQITTKEYLEKALKINYNSYSANKSSINTKSMNKNSIREHLKNYFPERDCIALVRPTIEEKDLQNLCEENLRPEFKKQIKELRDRIFQNMKYKELKGIVLNGELFVSMAKSYVQGINKGSIPNLESAFIDISKYEIKLSVNDAVENFNNTIRKLFFTKSQNGLPDLESNILDKIKSIKSLSRNIVLCKKENNSFNLIEECLSNFETKTENIIKEVLELNKLKSKEAMNEFIEKNFKLNKVDELSCIDKIGDENLKSRKHQKIISYLPENFNYYNFDENEVKINNDFDVSKVTPSNNSFKNFMTTNNTNKFLGLIKNKENNCNDILSIQEYLEEFYYFCKLNGPKGPLCDDILTEFIIEKERSFIVDELKSLQNINENLFKTLQIEKNELIDEINCLKEQSIKDSQKYEQAIKKQEQERLKLNDLNLLQNNEYIEKIKIQSEEIEKLNKLNLQLNEEIKTKENITNNDLKKISNEKDLLINELKDQLNSKELDIALINQKKRQIEDELREKVSRIKELESIENLTINNSKKGSSGLIEKLESQIKNLNARIEKLSEYNLNLEVKINEKDKMIEAEKIKYQDLEFNNSKLVANLEDEIQNKSEELIFTKSKLNSQIEKITIDSQESINNITNELSSKINQLKIQKDDLESQIDKLTKEYAKEKNTNEFLLNEMNILKEKITKVEIENGSLQNKLINYENEKKVLIVNNKSIINEKDKYIEKLISDNQSHEELIEKMKKSSDLQISKIKSIELDLISLKESNESLNSNNKILVSNYNKLNDKFIKSEELTKTLKEENLSMKENYINEINEILSKKDKDILKYENLLKMAREEVTEQMNKNKQQLEELSNFYDNERLKFTKNIEVLKNENNELILSMNTKFTNEINEKNEEISNLKMQYENEIEEIQLNHDEYVEQLEKEIADLTNINNSLTTKDIENEKSIISLKELQNETLKTMTSNIESIRNELNTKLDEKIHCIIILEKEKSVLQSKVDSLKSLITDKENLINEQINKISSIKEQNKINENINSNKLSEINDKLNSAINSYDTKIALLNQELNYKESKIQANLIEIEKLSQEKLAWQNQTKELRLEIEEEFKNTIDLLFNQKQKIEEELLLSKKELIKLESNYKSTKSALEKEIAVLNEKYEYSQRTKEEIIDITEKEREKLKLEMEELNRNRNLTHSDYKKEIENLKTILNEKESEIKNLRNKHSSELESISSKLEHYKKQISDDKKSYSDQINVYESKIYELKNEFSTEKEKLENMLLDHLNNNEKLFTDQIKILKENNSKLTKDNSDLNEKINELNIEKNSSFIDIERLKSEMFRLNAEIENYKKQMINMASTNEVEIISNLNKEIENLNKQLKEIKLLSDEYIGKNILLEKKLLEFENRESQNQLNLEILKSQYTKEKDSLESIIKSNLNPKSTSFTKDNSDSNYFKEVVKSAVKEQIKEIKIPKIRQQSPTCIIGLNRSLTNSNSNSSQTSTHRGSRNGSGVFKSAFKENKENKNDINRNLKIDCDNFTDFKKEECKTVKNSDISQILKIYQNK